MKLDLVMWTKNGEATLNHVLRRINREIPEENVNRRFIVDDASTDKTRKIAGFCGWEVVDNEGAGISDGANTALKNVDTDVFCSFEQDLLLCEGWFKRVVPHLEKEGVAAASGIRHQHPSETMRRLHEYTAERYVSWRDGLPAYLSSEARLKAAMSWGRTLDNTVYNTEILKGLGGFPKLNTPGGIDTVLTFIYFKAGYEWHVDFDVVSRHLNKSFLNELKCQYNYGTCYNAISEQIPDLPVNIKSQFIRLIYSPVAAVHPTLVKRCPGIFFAYPLIRFNVLRGLLNSRKGA